jgi:hypothetical protein
MTNPPSDLLAFRQQVMATTGLGSAADVGIVGDGAHARTGGYHEGVDVLASIGRYHSPVWAHAGSSGEDYSCRLARDRTGLTMSASAMDIGASWPHGGRAAWLAFNNALANALRAGDPLLSAVRAINYSPDGSTRWRIDRENGWRTESTSDSVDIHTHVEFYRDTEGRRTAALGRLTALMARATGSTVPLTEDDMDANQNTKLDALVNAQDTMTLDTGGGVMKAFPVPLTALVKGLKATPATVDPAAVAGQLAASQPFLTALATAVATQLKGQIDAAVEARLNGATVTLSVAKS